MEYKNGKPVAISQVVVAVPHDEKVKIAEVKRDIYKNIVEVVLARHGFKISINNLVFKVLRNKKVFDTIKNNKKEIVNNVFSLKTN